MSVKDKDALGAPRRRTRASGGNQSLEKGLMLLNLLNEVSGALGIREIARRLDLPTTVAHRLVTTLTEQDFLRQEAQTRKYLLGYKAITLGMDMMRTDELISVALPELQSVSESSPLNTFLGVISGQKLLYVLSLQAKTLVSIRNTPGMRANIHSTSMGKAILASADERTVRELLGDGPLERLTDSTITEVDDLIAHLAGVREQGFATSMAENVPGIVAVSATIRDSEGRAVAATGAAFAPQISPEQTIDDAVEQVMNVAIRISQRLGCPPSRLPPREALPWSRHHGS